LKHGEWLEMIRHDLPFAENTAQRLIKIADDDRLANTAHAPLLPASRETLYELTKLDDATFTADGRINAEVFSAMISAAAEAKTATMRICIARRTGSPATPHHHCQRRGGADGRQARLQASPILSSAHA